MKTKEFAKPFKTIDEQIEILKNRNLIINFEDKAKNILQLYGYYKVINGYQKPFWATADYFLPNTEFAHILILYDFDTSMRNCLLEAFLGLERSVKTIISYEFCKEFGELGYWDKTNYSEHADQNKLDELLKVMKNIKKSASTNSKEEDSHYHNSFKFRPVKHYVDNYGDVPLWVMMESMTLGNLSVMYSLLKPSTKKHIADTLSDLSGINFSYADITISLKILTLCRNACAHDCTIYNFQMQKNISKNNAFLKEVKKYYPNIKTNNIAGGIIVLASLLSQDSFKSNLLVLKQHFESLQNVYSPQAYKNVKDYFGFDLPKLFDVLIKVMR